MDSLVATLKPIGIFNLLEAFKQWEVITRHLQLGIQNILIDLSEVDYIEDDGLSCLTIMLGQALNQGGKIYFCSPQIQPRMSLSRLNQRFQVFNNKADFENFLASMNVDRTKETLVLPS